MTIPLPNLDDRRWSELAAEARTLIPVYGPEWTDHNASDPGITFAELFAWITEMEIFQLNQVPGRHRRKFLALAGCSPRSPRPARALVQLRLAPGTPPLALPATLELTGLDVYGRPLRFRTLHRMRATPVRLETVTGVAGDWRPSEVFEPFGPDPTPGACLVLGLSEPLPRGVPLHLGIVAPRTVPGEHHSARIVWEAMTSPGHWIRLDVADGTRALTSSGIVTMTSRSRMHVGDSRSYLRCRFLHGSYDEAPRLSGIAMNAVEVEQSVPAGETTWPIAAGTIVTGTVRGGITVRLLLRLEAGKITHLAEDAGAPAFFVLEYQPPGAAAEGRLTLEAVDLGPATGRPEQTYTIRAETLSVLTVATLESAWRKWVFRPDFDASGRSDPHVVLDVPSARIIFGDGEHGAVPPEGARVVAVAETTAAGAGNLPAGQIAGLADNSHNRALLGNHFDGIAATLEEIGNPLPAVGGTGLEPLSEAEARAARLLTRTTRAITLADYERLAMETPGVLLARAEARAGLPCLPAAGIVTVLVLPSLPLTRPAPSPGLLAAVTSHLGRHRILGTRIIVTGPSYTKVAVRALVHVRPLIDPGMVRAGVVKALDAFFHPLTGGPDATGWPFGRDVYRTEVLQVIDGVPGVDAVTGLALVAPGGPECTNVCVGETGLVDAGQHEIEVSSE